MRKQKRNYIFFLIFILISVFFFYKYSKFEFSQDAIWQIEKQRREHTNFFYSESRILHNKLSFFFFYVFEIHLSYLSLSSIFFFANSVIGILVTAIITIVSAKLFLTLNQKQKNIIYNWVFLYPLLPAIDLTAPNTKTIIFLFSPFILLFFIRVLANTLFPPNSQLKSGKMKKFKIDFIGIGAEKAATYWIWYILREHPEICFSKRKELAFFNELDQHFLKVKNPRYLRGISWYKKQFSHCSVEKVVGEYTPTYLYSKKTTQRIKKHFPNVKLIACLRDPVKRAFSQYLHDKSIGVIGNITFEKALEKYDCYIKKGLYYRYLRHYFDLFPKKNILIITTDDIKKNPKKVVKIIYRFLGLKNINYVPKSLNSRPNSASDSRFPYLNRVLIRAEYFLLRYKLYSLHQFLEDTNFRRFAFNATYFKNRKPLKNYPKMKKGTKEKLKKIFKYDIQKLKKLIKRNLQEWK